MKQNKRDLIYLKLDTLKDKIVSRDTIINIIKSIDSKDYLKRLETLRKSKKIQYIFLNYYYVLSENERSKNVSKYSSEEKVIAVLNKLKIKWHYTLDTALARKKIVWQASKNIIILNNSISKKTTINKIPFIFIKTQTKYISDYSTVKTKNRISTNYPLNEKLFVDYNYFNKKVPIELKNKVKKTTLNTILQKYPKAFQNKIKNEL